MRFTPKSLSKPANQPRLTRAQEEERQREKAAALAAERERRMTVQQFATQMQHLSDPVLASLLKSEAQRRVEAGGVEAARNVLKLGNDLAGIGWQALPPEGA